MRQREPDDDEVRLTPPTCANQSLRCQLLVVGGGLSGLSAAEAAMRRGVDVILIEKGAFGQEAASALNAGQFLTGWVKSIDVMLGELAAQEQERGTGGAAARSRAAARVRAFLRRTVEGCQRLADLDHAYNIRSSVRHGAVTAAVTEGDFKSLQRSYDFMEKISFRALMPLVGEQRRPFFRLLSARQLEARCGTAKDVYVGGVVDRFGGSFRPRKTCKRAWPRLAKAGRANLSGNGGRSCRTE
jgi:glycine/D-amino acid oxidase-like deaminating enzyme